MASVWGELKRRNVVKVAVAYAVVGWLLVQIADTFFPALQLPGWTVTLVAALVILGFPLALILSWAYDLGPRGVERTQSAPALESATSARGRKLDFAIIGLLALALVGIGVSWFMGRDARWARDEAIPQIEAYVAGGDSEAAYALAQEVQARVPDDPALADLWPRFSWTSTITSDPPGATVLRRPYGIEDAEWEELGSTPLEDIRIPFGFSEARLELEGYRPVLQRWGLGDFLATTELVVEEVTLDTEDSLPDGKVRVPGWSEVVADEPTAFEDFLIGRYEVTNREYKAFVEAGGYQQRNLWEHPFVRDGQTIPWEEAMALFTDKTGRPGPSTWEAGDYPDGEDDYPVTGVSWYEAAAYARYAGEQLPTVHQWRRAYASWALSGILPESNLQGDGPAPSGGFRGMSWYGAYDMAGNVREWCFNAVGDQRAILGGGWNDLPYVALDLDFAQPALDRSPTNGFRLAITRDEGSVAARAMLPVPKPTVVDITTIEPLSDEALDIIRGIYDYDRTPLNATVDVTEETRSWTRERISFDAAYGGERMILYLYLPRTGSPPYQTVLFWPGGAADRVNSIDEYAMTLDFILRDGRAVAFPVYKGIFERRVACCIATGFSGTERTWGSAAFRELVIQQTKDLRRSIDYLETRADIDANTFSYFGRSWGGRLGPRVLVLEPRLRAAVLYCAPVNAALGRPPLQPEISQVPFLPHVEVPVLVLNGEFDPNVPLETAAKPFFELLGTPDAHKRHVIAPGGHFVPRAVLYRETLDWLDKYLGRQPSG